MTIARRQTGTNVCRPTESKIQNQKMRITPEIIRDLAESPAIDPVLTWDGKTYCVGSRLSPLDADERIVLSRQELGDFLFSEGGDWDTLTDHDLEMAAEWVVDHRDEWVADEEDGDTLCLSCRGSGEGSYSGSRCRDCGGRGEV